jgi:hypothetical protein
VSLPHSSRLEDFVRARHFLLPALFDHGAPKEPAPHGPTLAARTTPPGFPPPQQQERSLHSLLQRQRRPRQRQQRRPLRHHYRHNTPPYQQKKNDPRPGLRPCSTRWIVKTRCVNIVCAFRNNWNCTRMITRRSSRNLVNRNSTPFWRAIAKRGANCCCNNSHSNTNNKRWMMTRNRTRIAGGDYPPGSPAAFLIIVASLSRTAKVAPDSILNDSSHVHVGLRRRERLKTSKVSLYSSGGCTPQRKWMAE